MTSTSTSTAQAERAEPRDDNAEAIAQYYTSARLLADNWLQLLALVGVGPHAAAIAASHVISVSLAHLDQVDADAAQGLVDELAAGLLKFSETLGKHQA